MSGQSLIGVGAYLRKLAKYIGPGFMVAVGYLDPGNWSTDLSGGSSFGYQLLFIIFVSNFIAIFLQNLAIRLGTVTGMDLAASEIAIIATDLAEVIGSAIAIHLLFPSISLPAGVAITAADVLIILLFYNEDDEKSSKKNEENGTHYFEWFVMLLVSAVGICFLIELIMSPVDVPQVFIGYLPSTTIFTDPDCLYVAIGIIGATVMPHNLFLHSFIVQSRCYSWKSERPTTLHHDVILPNQTGENEEDEEILDHRQQRQQQLNNNQLGENNHDKISFYDDDDDDDGDDDEHKALVNKYEKKEHNVIFMEDNQHDDEEQRIKERIMIQSDKSFKNMDALRDYLSQHINTNLHYSFIDLLVALSFAFFINSAILIVAASNFHQENSTVKEMSDLFDAHELLKQYIGPSAALIFAIALLCAGQSSTLTATLAGQVVMSGFLGMTTRPWLRRLLTRFIAIIPAMTAACFAGRSGLSQMLVASQVALSIQLPFAVVPLLYFTSNPTIMKLDLIQSSSVNKNNTNDDENEDVEKEKNQPSTLSLLWSRMSGLCSYYFPLLFSKRNQHFMQHDQVLNEEDATCMNDLSSSSSTLVQPDQKNIIVLSHLPTPLTYPNHLSVNIISFFIAILLICLNIYIITQYRC
ncbi:natural resistance-associated macrophage protein-domain-containing protein [Cunninghamella echinulata]|nr:natural resistance-associated macrophage protein-domain-containing protein [Cunninghamella echinulata]